MRIDEQEWAYGPHPSQTMRLFLPGGSHLPVALVVHGGFWRAQYGVELALPLARDLTRFGVAAAAVEYRRVGDGGGWPTTLTDLTLAADSLRTQGQQAAGGRLLLDRVAAVGHSAGGHLAAWLAHRGGLRAGTAGSLGPGESGTRLLGAVAQAGVLDLVRASQQNLGAGAVDALMEGHPGSMPQRYHHASPIAHVGDGARVVCVHGNADVDVPLSQSERYVSAAQAAGDPARLIVLPGAGHMELVDPTSTAWAICREQLLRML